jgi:hypothetical protein
MKDACVHMQRRGGPTRTPSYVPSRANAVGTTFIATGGTQERRAHPACVPSRAHAVGITCTHTGEYTMSTAYVRTHDHARDTRT